VQPDANRYRLPRQVNVPIAIPVRLLECSDEHAIAALAILAGTEAVNVAGPSHVSVAANGAARRLRVPATKTRRSTIE
jgi:hypothetical protein